MRLIWCVLKVLHRAAVNASIEILCTLNEVHIILTYDSILIGGQLENILATVGRSFQS